MSAALRKPGCMDSTSSLSYNSIYNVHRADECKFATYGQPWLPAGPSCPREGSNAPYFPLPHPSSPAPATLRHPRHPPLSPHRLVTATLCPNLQLAFLPPLPLTLTLRSSPPLRPHRPFTLTTPPPSPPPSTLTTPLFLTRLVVRLHPSRGRKLQPRCDARRRIMHQAPHPRLHGEQCLELLFSCCKQVSIGVARPLLVPRTHVTSTRAHAPAPAAGPATSIHVL
jgi:hypothetical protein